MRFQNYIQTQARAQLSEWATAGEKKTGTRAQRRRHLLQNRCILVWRRGIKSRKANSEIVVFGKGTP